MRALVQRVSRAAVRVAGATVSAIGRGLLVLAAAGRDDREEEVRWMAEKLAGLRVFPDDEGRMNRSVVEVGGAILVVSQFTLYGDCRKGKRPSFVGAARPEEAARRLDRLVEALRAHGVSEVATGRFGAMMEVELVNDGPVTLWIEREAESEGEGEESSSTRAQ